MSQRLKAWLWLRRNVHEAADALRFMHLQRCALALAICQREREKVTTDLMKAQRAYDDALSEYRLHHQFDAQELTPVIAAVPSQKGEEQCLPSKQSSQSPAPVPQRAVVVRLSRSNPRRSARVKST